MDIDSILKGHGIGGGGSNIKSIQRGTTLLNATTTNVSISAVDLTKSVVILSVESGGSGASFILAKGVLTTSTNLELDIDASGYCTVYWQVIEFINIKSLQSGNKITALASDSITISPVNLTRSVVFHSYKTSEVDTSLTFGHVGLALTTATNISVIQYGAKNKDIQWYVVEFN